jgi:hypothetical protein
MIAFGGLSWALVHHPEWTLDGVTRIVPSVSVPLMRNGSMNSPRCPSEDCSANHPPGAHGVYR